MLTHFIRSILISLITCISLNIKAEENISSSNGEISALIELSQSDPEETLEKATNMLTHSENISVESANELLSIISGILIKNGKASDFFPLINKQLNRYKHLNETVIYSEMLYKRAVAYKEIGYYNQAEKDYIKIEKILEGSFARDLYAQVISSYADMETLRGFHDIALEKYAQAYQIAHELKSDSLFGIVSNMGLLYTEIGDFKSAFTSFKEALDYALKNNKHIQVSTIYYNMARAYHKQELYDKAIEFYQESSSYSHQHNDVPGIGYANIGLGYVYLVTGKLDQSEEFLLKAKDVFTKIGNRSMLADVHIQLAQLYRAMQDLDSAIHEANLSLTVYKENNNLYMLAGTYELLSEFYFEKLDYQKAYDLLKLHLTTKNEQLTQEREKEISKFKVELDIAKQEHQNELLSKENSLSELELTKEKESNRLFIWLLIASTVGILGLIVLLQRLKKSQQKLKFFATTDVLTGLSNRRHILQLASQEVERHIRYKHPISFLILDIDKFKFINDSYGHKIGDLVLKNFASACKTCLRKTDHFGRLGGEDFLILLVETEKKNATGMANRLREHIANIDYSAIHAEMKVTVSIGISTLYSDHDNVEILINSAEEALHQAKKLGRNCVIAAKE